MRVTICTTFICKDAVATAIKWLKENNQLYGDIEIND